MKRKTVLIKITKEFKIDPKRPRPKWWDNYIGQTFNCYDECDGWWNLSTWGLLKLNKIRKDNKCFSAIIHKDCGIIIKK